MTFYDFIKISAMRKFDCRQYSACLSAHAHLDASFDCTACPKYQHTSFYPNLGEIRGAVALMAALFKPLEYQCLNRFPSAKDRLLDHFLSINREQRPPSVFDEGFLG